MKEGLVRYLYHVRRDTWNDRLEPKGQAETLRQKELDPDGPLDCHLDREK